MTRVLLVSTSYPNSESDWRGRFVAYMVESLATEPELLLATWAPPGPRPDNVEDATDGGSDARFLADLMAEGGIAHLLRGNKLTAGRRGLGLLRRLRRLYRNRVNRTDVVHVNWLQNALPLWGTDLPAVIPVLGSDLALLDLPGMVGALRTVLARRRALLAPNAEWMTPKLKGYFGDVAEVRAIPFGVDNKWYQIRRAPADSSKPFWIVVSRLTRKKLGPLFEWGEGCFGEERELHLFGPLQEEMPIPDWLKYHGPASPTDLEQEWFPRASGLLTLSQHDEGMPQVVLEAMAAGVPVLASTLDAHRDVVEDGATGHLVSDRRGLLEALLKMEDPQKNAELGRAAQAAMASRCGTWQDCAQRFFAAYKLVLGHGHG